MEATLIGQDQDRSALVGTKPSSPTRSAVATQGSPNTTMLRGTTDFLIGAAGTGAVAVFSALAWPATRRAWNTLAMRAGRSPVMSVRRLSHAHSPWSPYVQIDRDSGQEQVRACRPSPSRALRINAG